MTSTLILLSCLLAPPADDPVIVKEKADRIVVKDKTKPIRRALEIQYARLDAAVENRDFEAFQALRTADFHTLDEHGNPHTPQQMADRARRMLERIQPPIRTHNDILVIDARGSEAKATVRQYFSKMLPLAGELRKVETWVTQDETWTLTPDGWKLRFVDNVRDGETYVDGKRIDPSVPYDPDAPACEPSTAPAE